MSAQPDHDQIRRYLAGELDDADTAAVEAQVAASEAWAQALQAEANLELALFAVADAVPLEAEAEAPSWMERVMDFLRRPAGVGSLLVVAMAMLLVVRMPAPEAPTYQLLERSGNLEQRSLEPRTGPAVYSEGSAVDLHLVPQTHWSGRPALTVLLDGVEVDGVEITHVPGGAVKLYAVWGEDLPAQTEGVHNLEVVMHLPDGAVRQHVHRFSWDPTP